MFRKLLKTVMSLALALFLSAGAVCFAATGPDQSRSGSISVTPTDVEDGKNVVKDMAFMLYQVGAISEKDGSLSYMLTDAFSGSGADLSDPEASGLAQELADYAGEQKLTGTTQSADENGTVSFSGLTLGLYLLVQANDEDFGYTAEPFLVSVPGKDDSGAWVYDVDASPKTEVTELIDLSVTKVWNDGKSKKSTANRPDSVSVTLYRGSKSVATVTLNEENSWTHTWTGLPKSDAYSVKEAAVSGYTAGYSRSGNSFTITNSTSLAKTGQLNWPIPVLAGSGVALFALGWALVFLRGKQKTDE